MIEGVQRGCRNAPFGHGVKGSSKALFVDGISQGSSRNAPFDLSERSDGFVKGERSLPYEWLTGDTVFGADMAPKSGNQARSSDAYFPRQLREGCNGRAP